jgi:RNA polymerase sigma-70 factor, ECF subfamily
MTQRSPDLSDRLEKWIIYWMSRGGEHGREKAFDRIWRLYHKRVLYFVRQRAAPEAEDLAQEIFIKVFRNLDRFDPSRPFVTWIYAVARNHCINHAAKRGPAFESHPPSEVEENRFGHADTPESILIEKERDRILQAALSRLDPDSREMAFLKYFEGLKTRQIADVTGLAEGTVKSRLFAIRGALRAALEAHEN